MLVNLSSRIRQRRPFLLAPLPPVFPACGYTRTHEHAHAHGVTCRLACPAYARLCPPHGPHIIARTLTAISPPVPPSLSPNLSLLAGVSPPFPVCPPRCPSSPHLSCPAWPPPTSPHTHIHTPTSTHSHIRPHHRWPWFRVSGCTRCTEKRTRRGRRKRPRWQVCTRSRPRLCAPCTRCVEIRYITWFNQRGGGVVKKLQTVVLVHVI